ncbi:MAG: hypothetical protein DWQ02_04255 [Bacteroidetes bacterium]|nr:MAG: hypothetical protein DWQ02_04255 [Bacteroidota bacterium]
MKSNTYLTAFVLAFLLFPVLTRASIFTANTSVNAGGETLTLDMNIDTDINLVTLTMTGPDNVFFAFGFGGTSMNNTYAIIMEGNGNIMERALGNHNSGTLLTSSITVIQNTTSGGVRTVQLTRAINGLNASYFTFPSSATVINFIYSRGSSSTLQYHGFANKGISSISSVLPVSMLTFEANAVEKKVFLNWSTAQEINNKQFEIRRSPDAKNWQTIGSVPGHGNSQTIRRYEYEDLDPMAGINFYQLVQTDFDGTQSYSDIKGVEFAPDFFNDNIKVYPTVTNSVVTVETTETFQNRARIQVVNSNYQKVKDIFWDSGNNRVEIPVDDLPGGMYFIMVKHNDWYKTQMFSKQ